MATAPSTARGTRSSARASPARPPRPSRPCPSSRPSRDGWRPGGRCASATPARRRPSAPRRGARPRRTASPAYTAGPDRLDLRRRLVAPGQVAVQDGGGDRRGRGGPAAAAPRRTGSARAAPSPARRARAGAPRCGTSIDADLSPSRNSMPPVHRRLEAGALAERGAVRVELRGGELAERLPGRVQRLQLTDGALQRVDRDRHPVLAQRPRGGLPLVDDDREPQLHDLGGDQEDHLAGIVGAAGAAGG